MRFLKPQTTQDELALKIAMHSATFRSQNAMRHFDTASNHKTDIYRTYIVRHIYK